MEYLLDMIRFHLEQGLVTGTQSIRHEVDRNFDRGVSRALARTTLQHP